MQIYQLLGSVSYVDHQITSHLTCSSPCMHLENHRYFNTFLRSKKGLVQIDGKAVCLIPADGAVASLVHSDINDS